MSKSSEPCLCGAPDCRYCFPGSWKENELYEKYCDEVDEDSEQTFTEWLTEYESCEAEQKYDRLQNREDDRLDKLFNEGIN